MTMITDDPGSDEYKKQKYLVNNLKKLAKKYELVIILVAHANKKSAENRIPNMFDVSGAAEIVNLADYVLKAIREIKRDDETNQIISDESCLWIAKNRIDAYFRKRGFDTTLSNLAEWITTPEVMEIYNMTEHGVRVFVSRYVIPKKRLNGKLYYSKQHIDKLKNVT